jgi:hypothetical protein
MHNRRDIHRAAKLSHFPELSQAFYSNHLKKNNLAQHQIEINWLPRTPTCAKPSKGNIDIGNKPYETSLICTKDVKTVLMYTEKDLPFLSDYHFSPFS